MILSFKDEETKFKWKRRFSKKIKLPVRLHIVARRKLRMIAAATTLETLRVTPHNRLEALKGNREGPAETAVKLGKFFSVPAEFWMNLQTLYDIEEAQRRYKKDIESIQTVQELQHSSA